MSEEENTKLSILCVIIVTIEESSYNAYTVTQKCTSHLLLFSFHTFKAFSDKCVKGSHCVHLPPAPAGHLFLTLCKTDLSFRESKRGRKGEMEWSSKKEKSFTLWPLSRPRAGSRTEPTTSLHGACPLCYSNSLVTVLNPRGSLTQALGSQAWLLTASRWKALDIALHVTYSPGLAKSLETSASSLVCKD